MLEQLLIATFLLIGTLIYYRYEVQVVRGVQIIIDILNNVPTYVSDYKSRNNQKDFSEICFSISRYLRAGNTLDSSVNLALQDFPIDASFLYKQISMQEKMLAATYFISKKLGGNASRAFEKMGESISLSKELQEETKSSLSQVTISTRIISSLPFALVCFSLLMGTDSSLYLFINPMGWILLLLGLIFELCGIYWMRSQVNRTIGAYKT